MNRFGLGLLGGIVIMLITFAVFGVGYLIFAENGIENFSSGAKKITGSSILQFGLSCRQEINEALRVEEIKTNMEISVIETGRFEKKDDVTALLQKWTPRNNKNSIRFINDNTFTDDIEIAIVKQEFDYSGTTVVELLAFFCVANRPNKIEVPSRDSTDNSFNLNTFSSF